MRSPMAMSRRKFLLLSGGIAGFLAAATDLTWPSLLWQDQEKTLHSRLIALLHHANSARMIGQIYLQRYPQDADVRVLLKKVVADTSSNSLSDGADWLRSASDRDLMDVLQRRIRQDFTEERVVKLHGWILSATEARLCALTVLA